MDCNKEEAQRARDMADKKMQSRDFVGAQKLLQKALHLTPDIENASHMLTVCDVHCSAGSLVNGQTDHYGILQVESSADEALIRKQYRRLALLLHPDKNKFSGAEAAFKLVGEAYKVLSDRGHRLVYDSRRVQMRPVPSRQPSQHRDARRYTGATNNASCNQYGVKQHDQQPAFFSSQTFWTMCIFCSNRFQYSRAWLNREVQCQRCFHKFHAFEVSPQNIPHPGSSSGVPWSHPVFHHADIPSQHSYNHGGQTNASNCSKPATATTKDEKVKPSVDGVAGNRVKSENSKSVDKSTEKPSSGKARGVRNRRAVVNSSDSDSAPSDSTDSDIVREVDATVLDGESTGCRYPRRSTRRKTNVIYAEDESEDDFASPRKRVRKVQSDNCKRQDASPVVVTNGVRMKTNEVPKSEIKGDHTGDDLHGDNIPSQSARKRGTVPERKEAMDNKYAEQVRASTNANAFVGSKSRAPQVSSSISYPDPQFYDFDIARHKSKFAVNQIWAVYDESDGMPRWYALIQKVFTPGFKLQYSWLEYNPTSTAERAWVDAGLPIACGNFRPGKKLCTGNSLETFSHLILFEEVIRGNTYSIYPKKGEVWALFKEWDVGWSSAAEPPTKYDYEFVEVISDFAYGKDITVSHLVKVEGFLYLFMKAHDKGVTMIPSGQLLKFSHRIPHYNICGEREGIPINSVELDPAALPQSFVNVTDSFNADTAEVLGADFGDPCSKPRSDEHKLAGGPVKNKGLRSSASVFETASRKTRGSVCGNSDDILDKSDKAREQLHVSSEAPYVQSRRFEAMEHDERDPCKINADNNDESDEDPTANKPEFAPTEFWDFDEERSEEKFKKGQIWALYNEVGEYPNYYALLRKADWEVNGFVNLKWLEFSPKTEEGKLWAKKGLPFACGRFKVVRGNEEQDNIHVFSHMVNAKLIKNNVYDIYPNTGEVWAVFNNLSFSWTSADLEESADYSVVEIIELDKDVVKALPLTKVKGYNYVFKAEARDATDIQIPLNECSRFSHRVPAFRLTNQESGKLKDFWELDPDSIPNNLLTTGF